MNQEQSIAKLVPSNEMKGFTRTASQRRIVDYADASGDQNPIHLDAGFAAQTRFGQRIAHGMLSLAFVWEMLALNFPQQWHQGGSVKVRFTSPVLPGETLVVGGTVRRKRKDALECEVFVKRPGGEYALSGTASVPQYD